MKKILGLLLVLIIIVSTTPNVSGSKVNQIIPPTDPFTLREDTTFEGTLLSVEFIYDDFGVITYERQASDGTILEIRQATPEEESNYNYKKNLNQALQWVTNRTAELEDCETDMLALVDALAITDWDNRSANFRNTSMVRNAECIEINSRINRITINKLLELLVADGITE